MGPTGEKSSFASCFCSGRRSLPRGRLAERGRESTYVKHEPIRVSPVLEDVRHAQDFESFAARVISVRRDSNSDIYSGGTFRCASRSNSLRFFFTIKQRDIKRSYLALREINKYENVSRIEILSSPINCRYRLVQGDKEESVNSSTSRASPFISASFRKSIIGTEFPRARRYRLVVFRRRAQCAPDAQLRQLHQTR